MSEHHFKMKITLFRQVNYVLRLMYDIIKTLERITQATNKEHQLRSLTHGFSQYVIVSSTLCPIQLAACDSL